MGPLPEFTTQLAYARLVRVDDGHRLAKLFLRVPTLGLVEVEVGSFGVQFVFDGRSQVTDGFVYLDDVIMNQTLVEGFARLERVQATWWGCSFSRKWYFVLTNSAGGNKSVQLQLTNLNTHLKVESVSVTGTDFSVGELQDSSLTFKAITEFMVYFNPKSIGSFFWRTHHKQ